MLSLLISCLQIKCSDFGVAFAYSLTAHGNVHANLGALTFKVGLKAVIYFLVDLILCADTDNVLANIVALVFNNLLEFGTGNAALRALFRRTVTYVNITANGANKLFHNFSPLCYSLLLF